MRWSQCSDGHGRRSLPKTDSLPQAGSRSCQKCAIDPSIGREYRLKTIETRNNRQTLTANDQRRVHLDQRRLVDEDLLGKLAQLLKLLLTNLSSQTSACHSDIQQARDKVVHIKGRHFL